jgi:hypothetical protein
MNIELPKRFTPDEAAAARETLLCGPIAHYVQQHFDAYPTLESAMFAVAQYWDGEADDAVHFEVLFSELLTPDLSFWTPPGDDPMNHPTLRGFRADPIPTEWNDRNDHNIPRFAAFTKAAVDRDAEAIYVWAPYAVFRRQGSNDALATQFVGIMYRPWLDGVMPSSEALGDNKRELASLYERAYPDHTVPHMTFQRSEARLPPPPPTANIPKRFSADEAAARRNAFVRGPLLEAVTEQFGEYPTLQSATFVVAQYESSGSTDEIHLELVFSERDTPDLPARSKYFLDEETAGSDKSNYPTLQGEAAEDLQYVWIDSPDQEDERNTSIPLFAAFCLQGSLQDNFIDMFSPYAIFRRSANGITIEVVGTLRRPWLDGVMPLDQIETEVPDDVYWSIYGDGTDNPFRADSADASPPPTPSKPGILKRLFGR